MYKTSDYQYRSNENRYEMHGRGNSPDYERTAYIRPKNHSATIKKYKLFPITLAGIIIFSLLIFLLGMLWSAYIFKTVQEPSDMPYMPYIIYFVSLFTGCYTAAAICKGMSFLPASLTAVFAIVISIVFSREAGFSFGGFILKIILSFIIVIITNIITKAIGRKENSNINLHRELRF